MYKNWKAICEIADKHFMWAIALLDLATDFGKMIAERLPEYFSEKEAYGPIPLSVLRQSAIRNASRTSGGNVELAKNHLVAYEALSHWMPVIRFSDDKDVLRDYGENAIFTPANLREFLRVFNYEIGIIYEWEGKKLALVDFTDDTMYEFVPAELIAVNK